MNDLLRNKCIDIPIECAESNAIGRQVAPDVFTHS